MTLKECPMCGEDMRLETHQQVVTLPGVGQTTGREIREWVCPECDYWEEAESGDG